MIIPEGTTQEQWDQYYIDLKAHEEKCERERPRKMYYHISIQDEYEKDLSAWEMMRSCDAPNKPGYLRANND